MGALASGHDDESVQAVTATHERVASLHSDDSPQSAAVSQNDGFTREQAPTSAVTAALNIHASAAFEDSLSIQPRRTRASYQEHCLGARFYFFFAGARFFFRG